jgi:hypothetical protein
MTGGLARPVEAALGLVDVGRGDRDAQILEGEAVGRERGRVGLHRTAGRCPPLMLTRPTPGSWAIFWASRVSARSSTWGSGKVAEVSPSVRIGVSAGFTLLYTGGFGRSVGKSVSAELIAACTSCSATSSPEAQRELQRDHGAAARAGRRHLVQPRHLPENRSSGAVTDEAITSGLAPG